MTARAGGAVSVIAIPGAALLDAMERNHALAERMANEVAFPDEADGLASADERRGPREALRRSDLFQQATERTLDRLVA
jgi:hypothetical protein